jgi:hypothetical protein
MAWFYLTGEMIKMINELYNLSEAMSVAGIPLEEWPSPLEELRKVSSESPFFKLSFSGNYSVYGIEEITDQDLIKKLGKWEPSNGSSFPVFNMPSLFSFSKEQIQQKDDFLSGKKQFDIALLRSWCTDKANNWDKKAISKLENCLHVVPEELKKKINKVNGFDNNSIIELIRLLGQITLEDFRKTLENHIFKRLEKQEDVKTLLRFLFSSTQSNDVQVVLDLDDWKPFGKPVANEKTIEWLNMVLIRSEQIELKQSKKSDKQDAFGYEYLEINRKMPKVKLAGKVGDVKLRSMFHEHQCQLRYKLIDDASYPINMVNRGKIQSALKWLKEPDREGKTWGMVDIDEILFAYPSVIPPRPIKLVSLLGASNNTEVPAKFESIAEDVTQSLKGLSSDNKVMNVQIFAIRKMDKARSKIVYFRNHNTEWIIKSAKTWREGCTNIPSLTFRVWSRGKDSDAQEKPEVISSEIPKPVHIARIINKVWKMDGSVGGEIRKVKFYQGLELLLEQNKYELAVYLQSILLPNVYGLVVYLGNLLHSGKGIQEKKIRSESYQFLPSLIGLLLYIQNRIKEEYMEDIPYLIGQMLKISDELQTFYCKIVRDGNVPPQLVGNSLMVSALETPDRTLAQLAQRISPYLAWAKQYRTKDIKEEGKQSWIAGRYLRLYERNATIFSDKLAMLENVQFNDREKAELFIGYLAELPKKEENANQSNQ